MHAFYVQSEPFYVHSGPSFQQSGPIFVTVGTIFDLLLTILFIKPLIQNLEKLSYLQRRPVLF